jgi:hypothetical protein
MRKVPRREDWKCPREGMCSILYFLGGEMSGNRSTQGLAAQSEHKC